MESEKSGHKLCHTVRHCGLNNENDRDHGELSQLVGIELRSKLGKDCRMHMMSVGCPSK